MPLLPPAPLGRGVVVLRDQEAPEPWSSCERIVVDAGTLAAPARAVATLHDAWLNRRPVAVELACAADALRAPERYDGPVHALDPTFELPAERLHFLVWANTYDARGDAPVWWHARKTARRTGGTPVEPGGRADLLLPDGTACYVDGGPPDPPELPTGTPVVHRWNAEAGSLRPAGHHPPRPGLAPDQLAAVAHLRGPARVIAPAGSGKTRVLSERVRHLVAERGADPSTVTALAFNTRAADELRARLGVGRRGGPRVATLNAVGLDICTRLGGDGALEILEEPAARQLVSRVFPVRHHANTDTVAPYLDALRAVRLELRDPGEVEAELPDAAGFAERFDGYREALRTARAVDFDEQIYRAIEILVRDPGARDQARARCRRLLVDEFQDLNPAHLLLIRLLAAPAYDCFGVGDDDQVIYGYSGATPDFLIHFDRYFPGAANHALEVNYRCAPAVAGAARHLLSYNRRRIRKTITSPPTRTDPAAAGEGPLRDAGPVALVIGPAAALAARCVGILSAWRDAGVGAADMAVLARVHSALLPVLVSCHEAGLPVASLLGPPVLERTGIRTALAYLRIGLDPDHIAAGDVAETLRRPSRKVPRPLSEALGARRAVSVEEIRRLARTRSARSLETYAADIEVVAAACARSTAAALRAIRVDVGLGTTMDALDATGRGAERSTHSDELVALESAAAAHPEAASFEPWLRALLARPGPAGPAVVLSSVHRVKGQEWERVVVFGATAGLLPHRLAGREGEEEERRVFHVALTRARAQVAVLADELAPSPFLAELDGTRPHGAPGVPAPAPRRDRAPEGRAGQGTRGPGVRGSGTRASATRGSGTRADDPARRAPRAPRPARQPEPVAAVPGLEIDHAGHTGTVEAVQEQGAVLRVGRVALVVAFGTEVRVAGRPRTLQPATEVDAGAAETAERVLRSWRSGIARSEHVPAYVVLSDRDLCDLARRRPTTLEELAECRGIGPIRLERYGDEILECLAAGEVPNDGAGTPGPR